MNNKKVYLLLVVVLILVAIGGYFLYSGTDSSDTSSFSPIKTVKEVLGIDSPTKNWQTYTRGDVGFSVKYPEGYAVKEQSQSSGPVGKVLQIIFMPGPEDKPDLWKGAPLVLLVAPEADFASIQSEFGRQKQYAEYYEESSISVAGIKGVEVKAGPNPRSGNSQHGIYVAIPFGSGQIVFLTFAKDKNQLEKEATPTLDAFLSTFKPD